MLRFDEVTFGYTHQPVLDGFSLRIDPGEAVALVGANGAGKTTVTRLAMALEHPRAGAVTVCDRSTSGRHPEDLAGSVAYVFQHVDQQLFARSVAEEVAFGPRNQGASPIEVDAVVDEFLSALGIAAARDSHPFDLAPTDRKLVGLASALAQRPDLLILDEPTQGMDRACLDRVAAAVREHVAGGGAALSVTHDMSLLVEAFDRVVLLRDGKVAGDARVDAFATGGDLATEFGIHLPPVSSLSVELGLDGIPLRFAAVVQRLADVAAGRRPG